MDKNLDISGFVDLQVNGYKRVNFSSPKLTEGSFVTACSQILENGTAAFLPTMITCTDDVYEQNLKIMSKAIDSAKLKERVLGIHAEGPFISKEPGAVGAHNSKWAKEPSIDFLDKMQGWANGNIKLLTIAAELPGVEGLAEHAVNMGITVSLGHQLAGKEDLDRLSQAGATSITHLGNAIPNQVHRHDNPIMLGLAAEDLIAMIITDGHHLPQHIIKTIIQVKGVEKIIVTSDASPLAGLEPGEYQIMGNKAILEESGRLYNPDEKHLVGSSATMFECMNYLASLELLSLEELLKVGFYNPLRLINVEPKSIPSNLAFTFNQEKNLFQNI